MVFKHLRLAPRVFIATSSLLIGTVLVTSVTLLYQTSSALRVEAERYAVQLADLLAADFADKGEISLANVMRTINATLNGPMEGQGHIAAHLVAAAVEAGYDTTHVVDILTSVANETILDEFWITDVEGFSYLTNIRFPDGPNAGELIPFKFSPDPAEQPQASKFYSLLSAPLDSAAVITQPAQVREIDNKVFKYVGVSGVDQPRIVQVGNELVYTDQEILSNQYATERTDVSAIIEGILGQNLLVEATMIDHLIEALEAAGRSPSGVDRVLARIVEISHIGEIRIASSDGTELFYASLPEGDALRTGLAHTDSLAPSLDGTPFSREHATTLHPNGSERYKYATLARQGSERIIQVGIPIESSSGNLLYAVYQEEADVTVQNGLPRGLWIFTSVTGIGRFRTIWWRTDRIQHAVA